MPAAGEVTMMLHKSRGGSVLLLLCVLIFSAGCATLHKSNLHTFRLKTPFHHGDTTIFGWDYPLDSREGAGPGARLIVTIAGSSVEQRVNLKRGISFHGLSLDRIDRRIDELSDRSNISAPVITTNVSLKLDLHSPGRYLILSDFSGYTRAVYSDVPNPPLRKTSS